MMVEQPALSTCLDIFKLLIPRVNFTNILCATFTHADPESAKKTDSLTLFFALLRSVCVKAAQKMLLKLPNNRNEGKEVK